MGITLYSAQSEENRRLKTGKPGLFLLNQPYPVYCIVLSLKTVAENYPPPNTYQKEKEAAF